MIFIYVFALLYTTFPCPPPHPPEIDVILQPKPVFHAYWMIDQSWSEWMDVGPVVGVEWRRERGEWVGHAAV